jgi:cytidylate kinase
MIVTIDGPAGSGKSTTARAVARRLGFRHLDSGAFYRAITLAALRRGVPADEWPALDADRLDAFDIRARPADLGFDLFLGDECVNEAIRAAEVNANVSRMASMPAVREWLFGPLRAAAASASLVTDGRDMGTVVFPEADLKVFLTADLRTRARRRLAEFGTADPSPAELEAESERLADRDRRDSERAVAPLRPADDAIPVDTTGLTFDEQVERIVALVLHRIGRDPAVELDGTAANG